VTCAQNSNDTYLYRTETGTADRATIAFAWPTTVKKNGRPNATYRLVRAAGHWKIDAIQCGVGPSFNWQ
jgi:hypothetical protein